MGEDFVRVFSSHSWLQSEIVKGRLEAEGIPVQLTGEQDGPYPVDPAELSVPSSFEAQRGECSEQPQHRPLPGASVQEGLQKLHEFAVPGLDVISRLGWSEPECLVQELHARMRHLNL